MQLQKMYLTVFLFISLISVHAQTAKITTYNDKETKTSSGATAHEASIPMTNLSQTGSGGAKVYFLIEIINVKAITAKYRIMLMVNKKKDGNEEYAYSYELKVPSQNGKVPFIYADFMQGDYVARLVNKDNDKEVYAVNTFSIAGMAKPDYKSNSTFVFCKSVDDNWNAVGAVPKIKKGDCISFCTKPKNKMYESVMMWVIMRVKNNGTEEYVNDLQQDAGNDPYRFLATDNVCEFSAPGKYRIYLFDKTTYDTHHGISNEYYGKGDLTVE